MKKSELQKRTVSELREVAAGLGLTGISKLRKADLVAVILNAGKKGQRAKPSGSARRNERSGRVVRKASEKKVAKAKGKPPAKKAAKPPAKKAAKPPAKKAAKPPAKKAAKPPAKKTAKKTKSSAQMRRTRGSSANGTGERSTISPRTSRTFAAFRERGEQRVRASKFYLAAHETPELDTDFEYPTSYGENRIALMVRDPYWLFTYWEFAPTLEHELVERLGEETVAKSRLILRVYDVTDSEPEEAQGWHDIEIAAGARNWYINVMRVEREYCVDIGLLTPDGTFILIARSNRVSLPPVGPSDVVDEEWVVVEALDGLYRESGPGGPTSGSGGWGSGGLRD